MKGIKMLKKIIIASMAAIFAFANPYLVDKSVGGSSRDIEIIKSKFAPDTGVYKCGGSTTSTINQDSTGSGTITNSGGGGGGGGGDITTKNPFNPDGEYTIRKLTFTGVGYINSFADGDSRIENMVMGDSNQIRWRYREYFANGTQSDSSNDYISWNKGRFEAQGAADFYGGLRMYGDGSVLVFRSQTGGEVGVMIDSKGTVTIDPDPKGELRISHDPSNQILCFFGGSYRTGNCLEYAIQWEPLD